MSAESELFTALAGDAPLVAVVGTRIYPDLVPQDKALPAIALFRTETRPINTIHGGPPLGADVAIEVWCMAETRLAANSLAALCVDAIPASEFVTVDQRSDIVPLAEKEEGNGILASVLTVEFLEVAV